VLSAADERARDPGERSAVEIEHVASFADVIPIR